MVNKITCKKCNNEYNTANKYCPKCRADNPNNKKVVASSSDAMEQLRFNGKVWRNNFRRIQLLILYNLTIASAILWILAFIFNIGNWGIGTISLIPISAILGWWLLGIGYFYNRHSSLWIGNGKIDYSYGTLGGTGQSIPWTEYEVYRINEISHYDETKGYFIVYGDFVKSGAWVDGIKKVKSVPIAKMFSDIDKLRDYLEKNQINGELSNKNKGFSIKFFSKD